MSWEMAMSSVVEFDLRGDITETATLRVQQNGEVTPDATAFVKVISEVTGSASVRIS